MAFDYDLFVIGGGSGGVRAARVASQGGARVALAEDFADQSLVALDRLRGEIDAAVRAVHPRSVVDTLFTADVRWAAPTAGLAAPGADGA